MGVEVCCEWSPGRGSPGCGPPDRTLLLLVVVIAVEVVVVVVGVGVVVEVVAVEVEVVLVVVVVVIVIIVVGGIVGGEKGDKGGTLNGFAFSLATTRSE